MYFLFCKYWTYLLKKNQHVSGPTHFRPVLFNDQVYKCVLCDICNMLILKVFVVYLTFKFSWASSNLSGYPTCRTF